jgi:hypothetical protein
MRRWLPTRQAYAPRMWPVTVAVSTAVGGFGFVIEPPLWILLPLAVIAGGVVPFLRIAIWRRRHPMVPVDEYLRRQRDNAWLN